MGTDKRDVYPLGGNWVGGGELVVNQHQERDVNARLQRHGEPSIGTIVQNINTPHWYENQTGPRRSSGGRLTTGGYVDPIPGFTLGRTDMGLDADARPGMPILALGDSVLTAVLPNWYEGQPLLNFRLLNGPDQGRFWYVAEEINPVTRQIGAQFRAGQAVAHYAARGTGIEIGWAGDAAGNTLAQVSGYGAAAAAGAPNQAGSSFKAFILGLSRGQLVPGGPGGPGGVAGMSPAQINPLVAPNIDLGRVSGTPKVVAQNAAQGYANFLTAQINTALANAGYGASGGGAGGTPVNVPGNVRTWLLQAMQATGVSGSLWLNMLERQVQHESGGDPSAVNNWDVNAARGTPSKGLLQVIDPTFRQYMLPGHGNIFNPVDNAIAAIRYMIATYGHGNPSLAAQVMWSRGGGGYATGGRLSMTRAGMGEMVDAGWFADATRHGPLTFTADRPTVLGVGEVPGRPERVTVEAANATGGDRPIHIEIHNITVNRKGDVKKIVDEELSLLADSLRGR
jgi:hypothetical protein